MAAALATEISTQTADSHVRAIIVDVNGRRRFEKYYSSSADRSRNVFSVTKSIMSTLVGIAIDEGRLGLDDRLSKLLPDHASTMKPAVARVTLRQILTMTAGFKDTLGDFTLTGLAASPNWTRYVLTHHDTPAGKEFHFSDYGANLLAPILAHATGRSPLAYARAKLFDPLGITTRPAMTAPWDDAHQHQYDHAQFAWPVDPQGVNVGFSSIKLRPRDLAASGSCSSTTAAGTAGKSSPPRGSPYGYLWLTETVDNAPAYFATGYAGQLVEVVPSRHLVIVVSSDIAADPVNIVQLERLTDIIVPAVR